VSATRRTPRQILREEVIDGRVAELIKHAQALVLAEGVEEQSVNQTDLSRTPDFTNLLQADLKAYFEDEIVPAIPNAQGGGLIDETELRHELAKKALVKLKLSALREGAEELGAPLAGARTSEDIAAAVAKSLEWDSEAVAKFVLAHEEEPTENRAYSARLYPFSEDSATSEEVESEVSKFMGRYIRVGLARWYAFVDVQRTDDGVKIFGKHMSYKADVDPASEHASLRSFSKFEDVESHISSEHKVVEVSDAGGQAARAAVFAATAVLNQRIRGYLPHAGSGAKRVEGKIHGSAEFILDILHNRLPAMGVEKVNPTLARFRFAHDQTANENKPVVKAVRFEGNHILDSAQACRFIVEEGRPIANIAFRMQLTRPCDDEPGVARTSHFPVKISLEEDHVQVVTGLGDDPVGARSAHRTVTIAVCTEMERGREDDHALDDLIERMKRRAESDESSSEPSILLPKSSVTEPGA
jgi:hypothetical protein